MILIAIDTLIIEQRLELLSTPTCWPIYANLLASLLGTAIPPIDSYQISLLVEANGSCNVVVLPLATPTLL